jgi:RND superfamily putative drug exporter
VHGYSGAMKRPSVWSWYARAAVALRLLVVVAWLAAAVGSVLYLPSLGAGVGEGEELEGFVAPGEPAVAAERRSIEIFGFPVLGRTVIVQRDLDGLSPAAQAEAVARAVGVTRGDYDTPLLGALPVANTLGLFPGSREADTTVLTFTFTEPWRAFADQQRFAEQFAARHLDEPDDALVGVTGSVPARAEQVRLTEGRLRLLEGATVAAIALIVGLTFRSFVAPLVTLLTAGVAAVVTIGVLGWLGQRLGVGVPSELRPLVVALLLGIVTDYAIFFLSGLRREVEAGSERREAARRATREFGPIVSVAGITVAAGTGALVVAESGLFRAFGPAMAVTVLVGLGVAVTLVPALMGLLGRGAFWPGRAAHPRPVPATAPFPAPARRSPVGLLTRRPVAAVVVLLTVGALGLAAAPVRQMQLGLPFIESLPADNAVSRAADAAEEGFAPGVLAPTEILVEAPGIGNQDPALARLGEDLERQPGVAGVLGPGDVPGDADLGLLVADSGDAARYLVFFDDTPLGASAIDDLARLQDRLPDLLDSAGLADDASTAIAGDTALALSVVDRTSADLVRIGVAALVVNLLLLVLFLRALVAPLFLLASSVLALAATLGLTTWLFQDWLGHDGLTFYVPFAAAVLLVALGSDYNIFAVGHVWHLARDRPVREAIRVATPQSTRAIVAAGLALATSFGLLALVPLRPFRELAFALAVGIALDVLVVRSLLVPSLLTLFGRTSGWPWAGLRGPGPPTDRARGQLDGHPPRAAHDLPLRRG